MCDAPSQSMRPALACILAGLLMASVPASAGFEQVGDSNLELIDSGPLTYWAAYGPGVAWGDYDQDGDLDVLIGQAGNDTYDGGVTGAENNGSQNFTIHIIESELNNSNAVQASDLDTDGDIDLLIGWRDGILWYENDGSPANDNSWTARDISTSADGTVSVFAIICVPETVRLPVIKQLPAIVADPDIVALEPTSSSPNISQS